MLIFLIIISFSHKKEKALPIVFVKTRGTQKQKKGKNDDKSYLIKTKFVYRELLGNMNKQWELLLTWQIECHKWKQWMGLLDA